MSDPQAPPAPADQAAGDAVRDALAILRATLSGQYDDTGYLLDHATVRHHRDITRCLAGMAAELATLYARLAAPGSTDEELRARIDEQLTALLRAG